MMKGALWLALFSCPAMGQDLTWTDASGLSVEGKGWADTLAFYDRLPARAQGVVRAPVWKLSRHTAGLCVRFVSATPQLHVRWELTSSRLAMPHMPATGVSGVDLYLRTPTGWRWAAATRPTAQTGSARLFHGLDAGDREWMLYLPLYNGLSKLELGTPKGRPVKRARPRPASRNKPMVFYGTSITQGGCASRPGMCHAAILGRRLDRPVINLGFSGNGRMDPEVGVLMAEIDASVYVVDCLPNMNGKLVDARARPFVRALRAARPKVPIVLVEDRSYDDAYLDRRRADTNRQNRAALGRAFRSLKKAGLSRLYYVDGGSLLGSDGDATVDGSHPTDLGFMRQADAMQPVLERCLR